MMIIGVIGDTIGYAIWPVHLINETELGLLAVYAVVGMALSQALWLAAVGKLGVALAAFHINIAPFYVMLIMLALGGGWDWRAVIGAAVVAFGVLIAQRD
jgi:drug/metabolite transporter (DMT)-like permease